MERLRPKGSNPVPLDHLSWIPLADFVAIQDGVNAGRTTSLWLLSQRASWGVMTPAVATLCSNHLFNSCHTLFLSDIGGQMAGVRQHILPRFLLKGFASRLDGQEVFTWVFRKGGNIFEANIKNVAVEKHFYTQPANTSVDDEITELERGFARLLDNLRNENDGFEITDPSLREFVSHLT
jgi:hypothetical protein